MPARLIRLGLEREAIAVLVGDRVFAQKVDRLAEPLDRLDGRLGRVRFHALASAPEDVEKQGCRSKSAGQVGRAYTGVSNEQG